MIVREVEDNLSTCNNCDSTAVVLNCKYCNVWLCQDCNEPDFHIWDCPVVTNQLYPNLKEALAAAQAEYDREKAAAERANWRKDWALQKLGAINRAIWLRDNPKE